ncbi:MAG: antitoxin [Provencibacterium sp.]|jgi:hypothetical protein|nr:antitoxin [Provencibacterium sp.]
MADLLKITTPLVKQAQLPQGKQPVDPNAVFDLPEASKVVKPSAQSEMQGQNNGMIQKEEAPTILMNLLKDPSVTVNFLKNIYMLQEIIKLLPVNNQAFTQEIEQLFDALMLPPEDIAQEMVRQENNSTEFKGELFDFLRELVTNNPQPEIKYAVANLLKSINCSNCKQDILGAVANGLSYLADAVETSRTLSAKLLELSERFQQPDAAKQFPELKAETLLLLKDVENSILFSPKMSKVISILYYNLSRFNDNPDFFQESLSSLLTLLDGKQQKTEFVRHVRAFLEGRSQDQNSEPSRVMNVLTRILGKQSQSAEMTLVNSEKVERIIHSLLSSPCNFTPLLHYVIPVEFMNLKSFAELWINPNGGEDERPIGEKKDSIHMLVVFDIEGMGQFEAELFVAGTNIDLAVYCPPAYAEAFSGVGDRIKRSSGATGYRFGEIRVDKLDRPRSLMDVFKSLPYKRTGVDVKI